MISIGTYELRVCPKGLNILTPHVYWDAVIGFIQFPKNISRMLRNLGVNFPKAALDKFLDDALRTLQIWNGKSTAHVTSFFSRPTQ
jgi:hypothetical protein